MRILLVASLSLASCVPVGVLLRTDPDTGRAIDDSAEPGPDLSWWAGQRVFSYDYGSYTCEWGTDTVIEAGPRLTRSDPDFTRLQGLCAGCSALYRIEVDPDQVCGWISLSVLTHRGLAFDQTSVAVWRLGDKAELLDAHGTWDGTRAAYAYEDSAWFGDTEVPFEVQGTITFPEGSGG